MFYDISFIIILFVSIALPFIIATHSLPFISVTHHKSSYLKPHYHGYGLRDMPRVAELENIIDFDWKHYKGSELIHYR